MAVPSTFISWSPQKYQSLIYLYKLVPLLSNNITNNIIISPINQSSQKQNITSNLLINFIITLVKIKIHIKMQRGRSQNSRTLETKPKNVLDKTKPASKAKNTGQVQICSMATMPNYKNISVVASPMLVKQSDADKQNCDILGSVLKIMSAAAQNKQKQILHTLSTLHQKQKKLLSTPNPSPTTPSLLSHIQNSLTSQLTHLKIQIGKRKLQNLDKHDLREDILNLNAYVMRRSKKEAERVRDGGTDLLGEVYGKVDEMGRIIGVMVGDKEREREKEREKGSRKNIGREGSFGDLSNNGSTVLKSKTVQLPIPDPEKPHRPQPQLQKHLQLQKQNLRLLKQLKKIEQEFQCVVQQKLMLQQQLERVKNRYRGKCRKIVQDMGRLRSEICQYREFVDGARQAVEGMLRGFGGRFWVVVGKIVQGIEEKERGREVEKEVEIEVEKNVEMEGDSGEMVQRSPGGQLKSSLESQQSIFQKYQSQLTQKETQINNLLKTLTAQKSHNETQSTELQLQLTTLQQANSTLQSQIAHWRKQYQSQVEHSERERRRLAGEIQRVQGILRVQRSRVEEIEGSIRRSWEEREEREKMEERELGLAKQVEKELAIQISQLTQQISQLKEQISILQQQNLQNTLTESNKTTQITLLQTQLSIHQNNSLQILQKVKQLEHNKIQNEEKLKLMGQEFENRRNLMIEECGMMLENKAGEIQGLRLEIQREKIGREDLLSFIREKQDLWVKKGDNGKYVNGIKLALQGIASLKTQSQQISLICQNQYKKLKDQLATMLSLLEIKITDSINSKFVHAKERLRLERQITQFNYFHQSQQMDLQGFIAQIWETIGKNKDCKQIAERSLAEGQAKPEAIKTILLKILTTNTQKQPIPHCLPPENDQPTQQPNPEPQKQQSELNNFEALSPQEQFQATQSQSSSFLHELEPFTVENVLGEQQFSLQEVINGEGLVCEVEALRNELAESFKRNERLSRELKLYQQKDMDKIFDF